MDGSGWHSSIRYALQHVIAATDEDALICKVMYTVMAPHHHAWFMQPEKACMYYGEKLWLGLAVEFQA